MVTILPRCLDQDRLPTKAAASQGLKGLHPIHSGPSRSRRTTFGRNHRAPVAFLSEVSLNCTEIGVQKSLVLPPIVITAVVRAARYFLGLREKEEFSE